MTRESLQVTEQVACYYPDLPHPLGENSSIQQHRKGRNGYYGFSNKQCRIHSLSQKMESESWLFAWSFLKLSNSMEQFREQLPKKKLCRTNRATASHGEQGWEEKGTWKVKG